MDFSHDWKSLWSISSVYAAPLLISGPNAKPLGPLFFHPSQNPNLLFSSPPLSPQITPPLLPKPLSTFFRSSKDTFVPFSLSAAIAAASQSPEPSDPIPHNLLQFLKLRDRQFALFFPTGANADQIGYFVSSIEGSNQEIRVDKDRDVFKTHRGFGHGIRRIAVADVAKAGLRLAVASKNSGKSLVVGLLLVSTLYSVHWFAIEVRVSGSDLVLIHLASVNFRNCVVHACWSPHLLEESAVLLETGELLLFDLDSCFGALKLPVKLRGTRIRVSWGKLGSSLLQKVGGWLSCEFGWHPRILIVACSIAVVLVDWRQDEKLNVTVLAKIEMCDSFRVQLITSDRFIAFCKAGFDNFYFSVATEYHLLLFDTRQPLWPVLKWDHSLHNPCYVNMFRLSELRPTLSENDQFKWASESGFAIFVGSFWNCEFSLFCYGPSIPGTVNHATSKISKSHNLLYAWELPSGLCLSGSQCQCGDCLVKDDFLKAQIPVGTDWQQKKDLVLGFCIFNQDLSALESKSGLENSTEDGLGGFTLIRLMSSGKLESQRYCASSDFDSKRFHRKESSLQFEDSYLYSSGQEDTVSRKCNYMKFNNLFAYLNGNLANILASKIDENHHMPHAENEGDHTEKLYYTHDSMELIHGTLKASGVERTGLAPSIANILGEVGLPTSIHEIASTRIWAGLSLDLLRLAFFKYSDLCRGQKRMCLEFMDVPSSPHSQLPPFFLREPLRRDNKRSHAELPSDALVGPVLPLPVLLALRQTDEENTSSGLEGAEKELVHQCDEVFKVANNLLLLDETYAVSLADDANKGVSSQEMQEKKELANQCDEVFKAANDLLLLDETYAVSLADDDNNGVTLQDIEEKVFLADDNKGVISQEIKKKKPFFLYKPRAYLDSTSTCPQRNETAAGLIKEEQIEIDGVSLPHSMPESIFKDEKFTTFASGMHNTGSAQNSGQAMVGLEIFDDLSLVQLKFDSPAMNFTPVERNSFKLLKRQFSSWQEGFRPYKDLCMSVELSKRAQ